MIETDQRKIAREAARMLWEKGVSADVPIDPRTPEFADAALAELQLLRDSTPGILKDVLDGAEIGAGQLDVDPMHGLAELVQNADDLGATEIIMSVRSRGAKRDLVAVHNGRPVCLRDVLAMTMAFVSTKRNDPLSTGKFGIGLKTLSRIADSMEVSCTPYHFRVAGNRINAKNRPRPIPNFYNTASKLTLIVLPLREPRFALEAKQWAHSWTPAKMLFLQSVTSLSWVDIDEGRTVFKHKLSKKKINDTPPWRRQGKNVATRALTMRDRRHNLNWTRYDAIVPIPKKIKRAFKATGTEVMISVALPDQTSQNLLYAGLPTNILMGIPFSINAPFDLNTVRTEIQKGHWNDWLWKRISEFVAELLIHLLENNPTVAWYFNPIQDELNVEGDSSVTDWLKDMHGFINNTMRRRGVVNVQDVKTSLNQLSYEVSTLEGLLLPEDYKLLTNGKTMLPQEVRDSRNRWRAVLDDQEIATCINVIDAVNLFSDKESTTTQRTPQWFIQLVAAALEAGLGEELRKTPCVLTDDPVTAVFPDIEHSGSKLVRDPGSVALACQLGLVCQLHPAYFQTGVSNEKVRSWLKQLGQLNEKVDDVFVLNAIAERGPQNPLNFADADIIALRDIVDRVEADIERELLKRVGEAVSLDAFEWVNGRRVGKKATISTTYLPATIDREPEGWPSIAGKTTGLTWVAPRYANVLNPRNRKLGVSGARRFLNMLGSMTSPRLVSMKEHILSWRYSSTDAVPILQREAFDTFERWPDRLTNDYISPDLEKVVVDICNAKRGVRRQRGLYLFRMLNRFWLRSYQQTAMCIAGYSYYRIHELGDVPCTWIARLADQPWLETEAGKAKPPRLLDIRSPLTEGLYGNAKDRFAWGLTPDVNPGLVAALGLQERPKVSAIVNRLVELKRSANKPDDLQIRGIYQYISSLCPESSTRPDLKVDDLTVAQLRGKFGIGAHKTGLLWTNDRWQAPSGVKLGRPIFGSRRSFVSESRAMERLWRVLGIRKPNIADCIEVLNEIANSSSPQKEGGVLTDIYRHVNDLLEKASNKERNSLVSIPVSVGEIWATERPVYVLDDLTARDSLTKELPMWHPPCSLDGMDNFIKACNLSRIPAACCAVMGIGAADYTEGKLLEPEFQSAVDALQNYLAQNEPHIYQDLICEWSELRDAKLVISKNLGLEVSLLDGSTVNSACDAHLLLNPLTIYLRSPEFLFRHESGGRVISQCFKSYQHRHIVSLAWCNPSVRASLSDVEPMALAVENLDDEDPLELIRTTVSSKVGIPIAHGRHDRPQKPDRASPLPFVMPRKLKNFDSLSVSSVGIINASSIGGKLKPSRKPKLKEPGNRGTDVGDGGSGKSAPMGYTDSDREQLALQLLAAVVTKHKTKLKDFTKLKSIGADIGDGLSRFFEVKAYSGEMPEVVSIEMSEILRAQKSGRDFYLAVVAGLEEGYPTVIKLFAKPLETLDWTRGTSIKLAGVKSKRALEIHLDAVDVSTATLRTPPDTTAVKSTTQLTGEKVVRVPVMITKKMRGDLRTLGYTQKQIDKMTPKEAWNYLNVPST